MYLVCCEENSGRIMYLTKCLGLFFWAPCKLSAFQFEDKNIENELVVDNEGLIQGKNIKIEKAVRYIPVFVREYLGESKDNLYLIKEDSTYFFYEEFIDELVLRFDSTNEASSFIEDRSLAPAGKHWVLEHWEEPIKQTFVNR